MISRQRPKLVSLSHGTVSKVASLVRAPLAIYQVLGLVSQAQELSMNKLFPHGPKDQTPVSHVAICEMFCFAYTWKVFFGLTDMRYQT